MNKFRVWLIGGYFENMLFFYWHQNRNRIERRIKMQSNENDDTWSIASIEEQYIEAIERQPNYENQYLNERDTSIRNMFNNFQESATSIATLYRGTFRVVECHGENIEFGENTRKIEQCIQDNPLLSDILFSLKV